MKIVILGASANMAQPALRHLNDEPIVKEIVLTDINEARLREIENELGEKATYEVVDVRNINSLTTVIRDSQLVMNFIGPYFRFKTIALEVAINNGVNYIDLCDDYDVTLEALKLDGLAKEKDITAITGMGASPGITNVLAKLGANQLDKVEEINTYWIVGDAEPSGFGALIHMFHIIGGKVPTFEDGKETWIRSFQHKDSEVINFGDPIGKVRLYPVGHPEPVTLPKYIEGVKRVTNFGALLPEFQNPMFKTLVDLGMTSEQPIKFQGKDVKPIDFLISLFSHKQAEAAKYSKGKSHPSVSGAKIEVNGEKDGKKVTYEFIKSAYDKMDQGTSVPAGIVASLLLKGNIESKGVVAPEGLPIRELLLQLKAIGYFDEDKGFNVVRTVDGEKVSGNLIDKTIFNELWE